MRDPEKLRVYRQAKRLEVDVYRICRLLPREEGAEMKHQLRSAANSMRACIGEGSRRGTRPDFARFLDMSLGSTSEVQSHLEQSRELFGDRPGLEQAVLDAISVGKQLNALLKRLRRDDSPPHRPA
ncbi:MAG: four helix bundle protein [Gemmatimonadetes bacterium]|nr:four helix bundle protein [Gemmatimonadota bacterium]